MLNPQYADMIDDLKDFFEENGYVQLQQVFSDSDFLQQVRDLTFKPDMDPLHHSYQKATCEVPADIIAFLVKFGITVSKATAYKMTWKDYSMISDADPELDGVQVIIDATPSWNEEAGGAIVYVDDEDTTPFEATPNSMTIITATGKRRFFQYVNHYGGDRFFVILE